MRTIKLELVRHGPPHNQLLSPLTSYLALCENHPPVTVHVPFEHNQLLYRLKDLYYQRDESAREIQLFEMGRTLGTLLGQIPGLIAEVSREQRGQGSDGIQLRLILSSSELALLPFELALSTEGLPGAGLPLVLQSDVPICITREVRRSRHERADGAPRREARILFAWSSPPEYTPVPHEAHLLALRQAADPWWKPVAPVTSDAPSPVEMSDDLIKVLPCVSIRDIEYEYMAAARANRPYTHVHILAHGRQQPVGFDFEFGLALHDEREPNGKADVVLGERLATALGARSGTRGEAAEKPRVVTIASCYGGAKGSVAGAGASVAHALHVDGIPVVIAAQFPLGYVASVRMVEVLYERLLWGEDPRLAVSDLRRSLHAELPNSHDWAGITVYSELESAFESYLTYYRLDAIEASISKAQEYARMLDRSWEPWQQEDAKRRELQRSARREKDRLDHGTTRLQELQLSHFRRHDLDEARTIPFWEQQWATLNDALANAYETQAVFLEFEDDTEGVRNALREAQSRLWDAWTWYPKEARRAIKYLWMEVLLRHHDADVAPADDDREIEREPVSIWASAHSLLMDRLHHSSDDVQRLWQVADLLMLHLAGTSLPGVEMLRVGVDGERVATKYARVLAREGRPYPGIQESITEALNRFLRQYKFLSRGVAGQDPLTRAAGKVMNELSPPSRTGNLGRSADGTDA